LSSLTCDGVLMMPDHSPDCTQSDY